MSEGSPKGDTKIESASFEESANLDEINKQSAGPAAPRDNLPTLDSAHALPVAVLPPALGATSLPTTPQEDNTNSFDMPLVVEEEAFCTAEDDQEAECGESETKAEELIVKSEVPDQNNIIEADFCKNESKEQNNVPEEQNVVPEEPSIVPDQEFKVAGIFVQNDPETKLETTTLTVESTTAEEHEEPPLIFPESSQNQYTDSNDAMVEKIMEDLYDRVHSEGEDDKSECCTCEIQCTCFQKGELLSNSLRKGRSKGWKMYKTIVFPLVQNIVRGIWVMLEFITAIVAFGLSLASTLRQDRVEVFNYVHLGLVSLSIALSILDIFMSIRCCCCNASHQVYNVHGDQANKCCSCCSDYVDIVRMLLAEALIHPLIICDMFEIITGRGFEGNTLTDRISFSLLILSCFSFVLYVFIARVVILGGMIVKVQKARMRSTFELNLKQTYSLSALFYQLVFLTHLLFQMVAQILALIAVGVCIYAENQHIYEDGNTENTIHVSWLLWSIMSASYIAPVIGFFTFFIVTYYWAQEFPVALCLDMISLWKMKRGPDDFIHVKEKVEKPTDKMMDVISRFFDLISSDFGELHNENWCKKFTYPFRTPVIVVFCVFYALLQMAFAGLALTILFIGDFDIDLFSSFFGWFIFFCVAIGVGAIANAYAFAVAAFWAVIVPTVALVLAYIVAAIVIVVLVILGVPLLFIVCLSSNDDNC